jgi:two-component system response regulator MprA
MTATRSCVNAMVFRPLDAGLRVSVPHPRKATVGAGNFSGMRSEQPNVLVVDDERHMRDFLEIGLAQNGFSVSTAPDGVAALKVVEREAPDVIVLDVMLPKIDGISLLPMMRRTTEVPILMLSAKTDLDTRVGGLENGADDYLAKPFELPELVARLRTLLRRPNLAQVAVLRFADVTMDLQTRMVRRAEETISLSTREFDLLALLMRYPERVFTREQLLDRVWGSDREVLPGSVETYISYLRAKIDKMPYKRIIHTIRGVGYSVR